MAQGIRLDANESMLGVVPGTFRGRFQPLGHGEPVAACMKQFGDEPVPPQCGGLGTMGMGFQKFLLGFHPGSGLWPKKTRETPKSPGENCVGTPQGKTRGVESAGKSVGEGHPSGKAAGKGQRFAGAPGGGSRRLRIHKPHLAGKDSHDGAGPVDPTLDVAQDGQALE